MLKVHRTYRARIRNHTQVAEALDRHGWAASKLWNVATYYAREQWDATGEIPGHAGLKRELKSHPTYKGLHSQSSQRVLEEFAEAFDSWYASADSRDHPPGYRKRNYGETRRKRRPSGRR